MEKHRIQINTVKDRLNFALHAGVNTAMLGATVIGCGYSNYATYNGAPTARMLFAGFPAAVGAAWGAWRLCAVVTACCRNTSGFSDIEPGIHAQKAEKDSFLQQTVRELSERLGLKKVPDIHILSGGIHDEGINAYASPLDGITASKSFTTLLTPKDQEAIISHELVHLKERHAFKQLAVNTIGSMARYTLFADIVENGVDVASLITHGNAPLMEAGMHAAIIIGSMAAFFGSMAVRFFDKRYARSLEYQSDRGATQMVPPAQLIDALLKVRNDDIIRCGPDAVRMQETLDMFSVHPALPKRITRLRAMQKTLK